MTRTDGPPPVPRPSWVDMALRSAHACDTPAVRTCRQTSHPSYPRATAVCGVPVFGAGPTGSFFPCPPSPRRILDLSTARRAPTERPEPTAGRGECTPTPFLDETLPGVAHGEGNAARRVGHTHFPDSRLTMRLDRSPTAPAPASRTAARPSRLSPALPLPCPHRRLEHRSCSTGNNPPRLHLNSSTRADSRSRRCWPTSSASASTRWTSYASSSRTPKRAEAAEVRLAAIKDGWRGVENHLDMLSRREAEARAAFVRTLGTGEIGVPPSVPVFGAGLTSPYLPRPPVPLNVPNRVGPNTFPALPPAPVVGGPSVIWRHESGHPRQRQGPNDPDDAEPPHKRQRSDRRRDRDREREREVRKEKARFSDSPSPLPTQKEDTDLGPPIAALAASDDKDAEGDPDEEVDQIVDDVEMAGPNTSTTTRPRRSSDPSAAAAPAGTRAGSAGAKSDGAVKDLKKDGASKDKDAKTNGVAAAAHSEDVDAEGSPETNTDLSVDEELLKLTTKSRRPARGEYEGYDEYPTSRGPPAPPQEYHHPPPGWYEGGGGGGYYEGEQYRDAHRYGGPPAPRAEFGQRNGSASAASALWHAHLKQGSAVATNPQGQRTCRQCGLPGRYKDGNCVEKWGPGPEGPGTVCDWCRKKMKRVERRGTSQSQTQPTQPQTQLSQTQLGTQSSPQWWNNNNNGQYENGSGRYDEPRGERWYDLLPSHYGPGVNEEGGDEEGVRRKSAVGTGQRNRKSEEVVEAKEAPIAEA
ncbi:hypothetical protein FRC09_020965 [Ceratobasidium sp. 395]|nr:hypothetical protein FRC09_020965 [Ceratobasidium sp. 395]